VIKRFGTIDEIRAYARKLERDAVRRGLHAKASIYVPLRRGATILVQIKDVGSIHNWTIETHKVRLTAEKSVPEEGVP